MLIKRIITFAAFALSGCASPSSLTYARSTADWSGYLRSVPDPAERYRLYTRLYVAEPPRITLASTLTADAAVILPLVAHDLGAADPSRVDAAFTALSEFHRVAPGLTCASLDAREAVMALAVRSSLPMMRHFVTDLITACGWQVGFRFDQNSNSGRPPARR